MAVPCEKQSHLHTNGWLSERVTVKTLTCVIYNTFCVCLSFETTFGNQGPRLVKGEGDGDDVEKFKRDHIHAWDGMATEGIQLTDETILIVELFQLVE